MSAHDGHLACVESTTSTSICAHAHHGRLVIRTGPGTAGWWPTNPDDLRRVAQHLTRLADLWAAPPGVLDGQLDLFKAAP